jgi:hypothetical protein
MLAETKLPEPDKMGVARIYKILTDQEELRDPVYSVFEY